MEHGHEIKSILRDIAGELKERNELTREAAIQQEEQAKRMQDRFDESAAGDRIKRLQEMRERSQEEADRRNAERTAFQNELLSQLRRMNDNLEALLNKQTSS